MQHISKPWEFGYLQADKLDHPIIIPVYSINSYKIIPHKSERQSSLFDRDKTSCVGSSDLEIIKKEGLN